MQMKDKVFRRFFLKTQPTNIVGKTFTSVNIADVSSANEQQQQPQVKSVLPRFDRLTSQSSIDVSV